MKWVNPKSSNRDDHIVVAKGGSMHHKGNNLSATERLDYHSFKVYLALGLRIACNGRKV